MLPIGLLFLRTQGWPRRGDWERFSEQMNGRTSKHLFGLSCIQSVCRHHRETDRWDAFPAMDGFSPVSLPTANKLCAMELGTGALRAPRREGIAVGGQGRVQRRGHVPPRR